MRVSALVLTLILLWAVGHVALSTGGDVLGQRGNAVADISPEAAARDARRVQGLRATNFTFHTWRPRSRAATKLDLMGVPQMRSTPGGFAARCDWVFGTRNTRYDDDGKEHFFEMWGNIAARPRTIFVRTDLLALVWERVFPLLDHQFVLITGDGDSTLPRQVDARARSRELPESYWNALLKDKRVVHMFIENLDEQKHPDRVSPLPIGLNHHEFPGKNLNYLRSRIVGQVRFSQRLQQRVLQSDRVRIGAQWEDRSRVHGYCLGPWASFCDAKQTKGAREYALLLQRYPFVVCVHGGGIDPNPKMWEALIAGTIPIIQRFPGDAMYKDLPVAYVDAWTEDAVTPEKLDTWMQQLRPYFEDAEKRAAVIQQLYADYWWQKVEDKLAKRASGSGTWLDKMKL